VLKGGGALFFREIVQATRQLPAFCEGGLSDLIAQGRVTCDSFSGLRFLLVPASRRRASLSAGRWSLLTESTKAPSPEFVARQLLRRTGVVFRKTLMRERQPLPWREIARACRDLEAKGEIRGGRFVGGFEGEQYALKEAVTLLRAVRREPEVPHALRLATVDPLEFHGILTPETPWIRLPPKTNPPVNASL
jgi:ATP-dependent Lhr-like helicase